MKKIKRAIFLSLVILFFSGCKKEVTYTLTVKPSLENPQNVSNVDNATGIPGVYIKIFYSEIDYKLNKNLQHEGISDEKGEFKVKLPDKNTKFWVWARKDTLNELRRADNHNLSRYGYSEKSKNTFVYTFLVPLSNSPIRLELQVMNMDLGSDASATLYENELDFKNDVLRFKPGIPYVNGVTANSKINSIIFEKLEPRRQYWFRVKSGSKTNSTTVFKTNGVLEDNPEITNVYTVVLQ